VFTSGDEAELFLNGKSLGKKKKEQYEYRLRWDDVKYVPGELKVIAYKNGKKWAEDIMKTTAEASQIKLSPDRSTIKADGKDLSFITVQILDRDGRLVPQAMNEIKFSIEGPGEVIATDNGDAAGMVSFASTEKAAFNGLCLVIIRGKKGEPGTIKLKAQSKSLKDATILIQTTHTK
jgi:beta-galactosidase